MDYIESDIINYYFHKFGSLLFGTSFFFGILVNLLFGGTITINDVETKATFINSLPFFGIGSLFIVLFVWMCFYYYRITLTKMDIRKHSIFGGTTFKWEEIETVNEVARMGVLVIFKFSPKNSKNFYTLGEWSWEFGFEGLLSPYKSKMGELIGVKKVELGL